MSTGTERDESTEDDSDNSESVEDEAGSDKSVEDDSGSKEELTLLKSVSSRCPLYPL